MSTQQDVVAAYAALTAAQSALATAQASIPALAAAVDSARTKYQLVFAAANAVGPNATQYGGQ